MKILLDYNIDSIKINNDFLFKNNRFAISNKFWGIKNIPYSDIEFIDKKISSISFPKLSFDYFLSGDFERKKFSLKFNCFDYGNIVVNREKLNKFIDDNEEILTFSNFFNEMSFKNLSFGDAKNIISTMAKLDNLILNKRKL